MCCVEEGRFGVVVMYGSNLLCHTRLVLRVCGLLISSPEIVLDDVMQRWNCVSVYFGEDLTRAHNHV